MTTIDLVASDLNTTEAFDRWEPHYYCDTQVMLVPGPAEYYITFCETHNVKGLILQPAK